MFHSKHFPIPDPCLIWAMREPGRRIWRAGDWKVNLPGSVGLELGGLSLGTWQSDRRKKLVVINKPFLLR